jgi:hypothetical protein
MEKNPDLTAKAEGTSNIEKINKGIRKINLEDLAGELSQRGRAPFTDSVLKEAFEEMLKGNLDAMIWVDAYVDPDQNENTLVKLQARFRNRATSVLKQVLEATGKEMKVVIQYTKSGEMVISQNKKG